MGLLDNNLVKTQGRTKSGTLFTDLSGVSSYTSNQIDCRGYNTLIIGLAAYTNPVDVQIVGIYPDSTSTFYQKLYGIDITKDAKTIITVKKEISKFSVPIGFSTRIMIDVSMFDYIGIGKTVDNSNTLSCNYQLIQKTFDIDSYHYSGFFNLASSFTGNISSANSRVYFNGIDKENAVLFKITTDTEFSGLHTIGVKEGLPSEDLKFSLYNLNKKRYSAGGSHDYYEVGTHYLVFPIENFDSIYFEGSPVIPGTKSIDYKFINFNFDKVDMIYNYWDKQNGAVGISNALKIPTKAKSVKVIISGNTESIGGKVSFNSIIRNADAIAYTSKLKSFSNSKLLYNETTGEVYTNGSVTLTSSEQIIWFDLTNMGWVSLGADGPLTNISAKFIFSENEPNNTIKQKITTDYSQPVTIANELPIPVNVTNQLSISTETQGRTKSGTLFTDLSGVSSYTSNQIDCRGYNTLIIGLAAYTNPVDVQIVGIYPDSTSTFYQKLYGIDITKDAKTIITVKKEISKFSVPIGFSTRIMIDVSMFDYIGIGKTVDNSNTLSCNYQLIQKTFDIDSYHYSGFFNLASSFTGNISSANSRVYFNGIDKENAVLFKITTDTEFSGLHTIGVKEGLPSEDLKFSLYNLNKKRYSAGGSHDYYEVGTHYLVFPIENFDSIYFEGSPVIPGTKSIDYKFINFNFDKVDMIYNYWDKQNGAVGISNALKIPTKAKSVKVIISGNTESIGGKVSFNSIIRNADAIAYTSKLKSFSNSKLLYNETTGEVYTNGSVTLTSSEQIIWFDLTNMGWVSLGADGPLTNISAKFIFSENEPNNTIKQKITTDYSQPVTIANELPIPVNVTNQLSISTDKPFTNSDLVRLFENERSFVYKNTNSRKLVAVLRDKVVWVDTTSIALSLNGFDGTQEIIQLNSTNFPGLITGSTIERVILLPWSRNATNSFGGYDWRMNVITTKGQVYHNFPSRSTTSDGTAQANDYKLFDESCIWELPERWTPVKTNAGADAALIATGKYRYFPALPDEAYSMYPAVNVDNGYGNGGFPAVLEKTKKDGSTVKFSRFYFTDRSRGGQGNPLGFMGGFEPHPKLSLIGTYKSNTSNTGSTRMCVFMTNDGGRNWFARYEFGANGELLYSDDSIALASKPTYLLRNLTATGMTSPAGSNLFNVIKRSQYIPNADNKEPEKTKKFKYFTPIAVQSITANANEIIVATSAAHRLNAGDIVLFEKQSEAPANEWDWIINTGHTELSAGDGVVFKAQVINATSFRLMECVYNPHNNLNVRHIHSINRCKDGYTIGAGETYPDGGWILWLSVRESDSFARLYPWDDLPFVRLNSTNLSIQRPLGVIIKQDADNTVFIGVDNELTELGNVTMPEGRTDTFKRSSNGVWKGKLTDVDSQAAFECVFQSDEVCYFFKEVRGTMVYIGQQGHVGISSDGGNTWSECHLNTGDVSRFGGISNNGEIIVENFIFKVK